MTPSSRGVKLTYDDFVQFPDDGLRHELIDGEHYVTPSPNTKHQSVSINLTVLIGSWLERNPIGRLFHAPFDVVFSTYDVVEPDLLYLSNERASDALTPLHVRGVPELVVEIGSPGTRRRDETIKRRLYDRTGVSEYWIVDPEIDTIRVYRREAKTFARVVELSAEARDVLTTSLLPGLEIPLSRVFRAWSPAAAGLETRRSEFPGASLLPSVPDDVIAVVGTVRIDHFAVADGVQRGCRQLDEDIVREQEAAWSQHRRDVGERQRLLENAVVNEDVGRNDQIETFIVGQRREPFEHDVQVARIDGRNHVGSDADRANLDIVGSGG